ncbi:hypothetical protein ACLB1G_12310 [Oxalobacteraceae bacterium A2-2]
MVVPSFSLTSRAARSFFLSLLAAMLVLMACFKPVNYAGDFPEYTLQVGAIANHRTADIRLDDIATIKQLLPQQAGAYDPLENAMRANQPYVPNAFVTNAFVRGREGKVYAIHFFGYAMLAALPYKLLQKAGLDPYLCFQVVNLSMVLVLGLALFRLFGSASRASVGLLAFMACGGALYWTWCSPETLSAAGLLAGMLFYVTGAPLRGGLLGGVAALQNPTILFFFGFAPLLKLVMEYQPEQGLVANLRRQLDRRALLGLALGLVLIALPPAFNMYQYGAPNVILQNFSDHRLITMDRFLSFFFDLNQGMVIAVPGLVLALLALPAPQRGRARLVLAVALLFLLALAVPALAVTNWNSAAAGIMRYVAWSAMPLLLVLYWRLSLLPRWPAMPLAAAGLLQLACMVHASKYGHTQLSPLALQALKVAPAWYHPEPEIFSERSSGNEDNLDHSKVYVYPLQGKPIKWLFYPQPGMDARLCGPGMRPGPQAAVTESSRGWRYIDTDLHCEVDHRQPIQLGRADMQPGGKLQLASGWSAPESGGGIWDGAWSVGERSQIVVAVPPQSAPQQLLLQGHYFDGNQRTRVLVNGVDLGWAVLDMPHELSLPKQALRADGVLHIELRHESPRIAGNGDTRTLAYFLQGVTLQ